MKTLLISLCLLLPFGVQAQRPQKIQGDSQVGTINLQAPNKVVDKNQGPSLPEIIWEEIPSPLTKVPSLKVRIRVRSNSPLYTITLFNGQIALNQPIQGDTYEVTVNQFVKLKEGPNSLHVQAVNSTGASESQKYQVIYRPADPITNRKDYVLLFAGDQYKHKGYDKLNSPSVDAKAIGEKLQRKYGFETPDIVYNPTTDEIINKLAEYATTKSFGPYDQLIIFYAGHGEVDQRFGESGSFVGQNSTNINSCLSHSEFLDKVDAIPCEHILIVANSCYSGLMKKFDRGEMSGEETPKRGSRLYRDKTDDAYLKSVLADKTRLFIASGSDKVFDAQKGKSSPFGYKMLDGLEKGNTNRDSFLELIELKSILNRLNVSSPQYGVFGSGKPGGTIVLVEAN